MKKIFNYLINSVWFFRIVLLLALYFIITVSGAYCQSSRLFGVDTIMLAPKPYQKPNKPLLYDGRIKCTAVLVEANKGYARANWTITYFYVRFSYLSNGLVDSNHIKYYYPDRKTEMKLIYWTNIKKESLDMDSKWIKLYKD